MDRLYVTKVWIDNGRLFAETDHGVRASYDLANYFKGFRHATPSQIGNYKVDRNGIHWPELDEDINFEGMFHDNHLCQLTAEEDSVVYKPTPQ